MANVIKIKRGSGTPTTSNLAEYQLGYDYTNNKLYIHDPTNSSGQEIVEVGGSGASTSGSNNQILTDDGSGGINSESKLTFDNSFLELTDSQLRLDNSTFGTYNWEFQQDDGGDLLFKVPSTGGAEIRVSADGGSNSWKTAQVLIAGEINLHADGTSYFKQGATPLVLGGTSAYTTGGTPRLSIQGAGLNIGSGTNDMSYMRRIATGEYQWQTWNGANDGELHLQPYGGLVGIGTTSPGYKLDVSGNVRFTSDLRNEGRLLNSVGSSASPSYSFYSQGNAGMYRSGDGVGFSAGGSSVYDINSTRMYINTNVGIGTSSPEDLLHVHSTGDTNLRIKSTANKAQIRYQNDTQSWFTGIASDESYFWYGTQIAGNAGFIQSSTGNLYWEKNVILSVNAKYLYSRDTSGALTRMFGMNGSNTTYIGPIDSYAGGRMYYGASANMSGHNFYTGGTLRMKLDGYVLDLPNTGDWSSILNNTNSGGLRFGTKDAGGTLAYQIELSNTGNYVKLNEPTQIIKETSTTASATGTTLFTLTNDVGADLNQQKTFVDFTLLDDNANETPQVRIGAEVGQNGDANSQEKEGSGAFVVYTNNADTTSGDAGASLAERMRVDYQGNVGIGVTSPSFSWGTRGIEIQGSGVNPVLRLDRSDSIFEITARSTDILLYNTGTARSLRFGVGASEKFRINSDGNTYVYETLILNANNESLLQRDTGGTVRNLIKLDSSNRVLIGDANTAGVHHHYPSTYSQINTDHGYLQIGAQNTSHCHYTTDRSNHWFNQMIYVNGGVVSSYLSDLSLRRNGANSDSILIQDNTVKVYTDSTDERFRFGSLNRSFVNQAFGPINNNSKAYIRANDGYSTSTTPDYTWWYNDQCGIYHPAGNTIGFSASGQKVLISTYGLYSADDIYINHGGSDYSPGLQFMGGSNTPGANEYENGKIAYYDNSGTGFMRYLIGRSAGTHSFRIGGSEKFYVSTGGANAVGDLNVSGNSFLQYGLVVNEGSHDADFRVESNSNAHMIQADAGNSRVGINNSSPYESLDAKSLSSTSPAIVANGAAANGCVNMAHGYAGQNGDYVCTYGTQYSSIAMVLGYGVKPSTTANDTFIASCDNANFTRGALVIDDELRFWQAGAQTGTLNNNISMTERFRLTAGGIGHFDGDVVAYSSTVSDKRLKENITTIDNALDKVMALRGVEYDWTATSRKGTHDIGLVAQEVEEVIPELVTEHELCTGEFGGEGNEKTFKTVNYDKVVGVLIEAIKEQQEQINELKEKLNG